MAKVRFRTRFYVVIFAIVAALILLIVLLISNRKSGSIHQGELTMNLDVDAVVIRNEICVTTERYDRIEFEVLEGAYVEAGTPVAQVYKWGYNEDLMQSLLTTQSGILTEQLTQLSGIDNPTLTTMNSQIDSKLLEIRNAAMGKTDKDMLSLENELETLMQQRNEYLRQTVQATERLNELYLEEQTRDSHITEYRSSVSAASPGIISFYADGYEQVLNEAKLNMVNAALINSVLKGASVSSSDTTATENLLYRLINRDHFYIAFVSKGSNPQRLVAGEQYTVRFEGYYASDYVGTALAPIVAEGSVVNIIEFNQDIGALVDVRVIDAEIVKSASGAMVPLDAIVIKDDRPGLDIDTGADSTRIEIDVIASDDENAIVRAAAGAGALSSGMTFVKP